MKPCSFFNPMYMQSRCSKCGRSVGVICASCHDLTCNSCHEKPSVFDLIKLWILRHLLLLVLALSLPACASFLVTPEQCVATCGFKGVKRAHTEVGGNTHKVSCICNSK